MFCSDNSDLLLFTPVPLQRVTANGWSAEVQRAFIANLAKCGVVSAAARSVGRSARSAWMLRRRAGAEGFAEAWDVALDMGRDEALAAALARENAPERRPVMYRGAIVGWREVHNDRLAIAALRAFGTAREGGAPPVREPKPRKPPTPPYVPLYTDLEMTPLHLREAVFGRPAAPTPMPAPMPTPIPARIPAPPLQPRIRTL